MGNNTHSIRNDRNIGKISVSRSYGGGSDRFVGSPVPSDTAITIKIQQAEKFSDEFRKEEFYGKANIVEVEMTPNQWAELITTLNHGSGTPCTIKYVGGERIEQTYQTESVLDYYENRIQTDFKKASQEYESLFEEARDVLDNKKNITKADREIIRKAYTRISRFVGDSAPFLQKLFKEDIEEQAIDAAITFKNDMESIIKTLTKKELEEIQNTENVNVQKIGMLLMNRDA